MTSIRWDASKICPRAKNRTLGGEFRYFFLVPVEVVGELSGADDIFVPIIAFVRANGDMPEGEVAGLRLR